MKKKSKVIVVSCENYEEETVYKALKAGIQELGGLEKLIGVQEKILVKPNFLSAALPEKAVTTHPAVIGGMFRILREAGYGKITYGDSPGHGSCENAAGKIGLKEIADHYQIKRANMEEEVLTPFEQGMTAKSFYFTKGTVEADVIISLSKMKTHALERITGGVKNVYGLICGARKAAGHVKYPNAAVFARMLADIHRSRDIRLHIMDGVTAMEGNGPGSGNPVAMRVLLFSADPVAIDAVFCHLVYLNPELVPTCVQAEAMGVGTYHEDQIEVILRTSEESSGRKITMQELQELFGNKSFDVDRDGRKKTFLNRYSAVMTKLAKRPVIEQDKCVKCGICVAHCPVPGKAVKFTKGKENIPVYDYRKCIRCYCCQEICPQHAITAKKWIRGKG